MTIAVTDFTRANPEDGVAAARLIREGFDLSETEAMARDGLIDIEAMIEAGALPRRTWSHAKRQGRLGQSTAQRIARLIRISAFARETFGPEKAALWLKRPTKALDGESPLSLLDTDEGARAVETLIGRIAHGIAA